MSEHLVTEPIPVIPSEPNWSHPVYNVSQERLQDTLIHAMHETQVEEVNEELAIIQKSDDTVDQKSRQFEAVVGGTYNGRAIGLRETYNRNAGTTINDRIWVSRLNHVSPEVTDIIVESEVVGFHATNSVVLAGLVEGGALLSGQELDKAGKAPATGTHDAVKGSRDISFGNLAKTKSNVEIYGGETKTLSADAVVASLKADIAEAEGIMDEYPTPKMKAQMGHVISGKQQVINEFIAHPNSLTSALMQNKFPIAIGVSREFIERAESERQQGDFHMGQSYLGEFRPAAGIIPLESLPVIGIPSERVQAVRELFRMFGKDSTQIVPLEALTAASEKRIS